MNHPVLTRTSETVFLMNPPLTLDTSIANNRTMALLSEDERKVDSDRAMKQWHSLYKCLSDNAMVYLLPSSHSLQDLCFVSNIGVVLNHLETPEVVISNFRAEGRQGESAIGEKFFMELGYNVSMPPTYFEGEADLKHLRGNVYFGGYGLRSSIETHGWLNNEFSAEVISIRLEDPHLYHLDCVLFVLDEETVLLCTSACNQETLCSIEKHCQIIDVPLNLAYRGATNSVRCNSSILAESRLENIHKEHVHYEVEKQKREFLERVADHKGFNISFFDLDEFHKSGAMLSCLVMPLCNTKAS